MFGFLLSRRWLWFALAVVLLAAICVRAGFWQYDKLDERQAENTIARSNLGAEPRPLDDVVAPRGDVDDEDEWTTVRVTGTYDTERQLTVKFSTRDGAPGVDVVTPLVLDDGSAVLVNRGWMPSSNTNERPTDIESPPEGTVEVIGWVRPDNGAGDEAVVPVDGQVRAVSSRAVAEAVPYELRPGYLDLRSQSGGPGGLRLPPSPDLGQGPHFFYAVQWWFFALLAVVGFFWFARAEELERRSGAGRDGTDQARLTRSA